MLVLIIIWWVCAQLAAPTWIFITLGFAIFLRLITGLLEILNSIIELAKFGRKRN